VHRRRRGDGCGGGAGRLTLSPAEIDTFVRDGFVKIPDAFPRELADRCRSILWQAMGLDPDRPESWRQPVVRLGQFSGPFKEAANTPRLHGAFDQLVGEGRWIPPHTLGTFPIRFPSADEPGDIGWHIDVSFGAEQPDYMQWRVNVGSRGRALLMLFLFSDVGESDAPTHIRIGSHRDIARRLAPAGDEGLMLEELVADGIPQTEACPEAWATGNAGTVYLCHPFLVHSAQKHRGKLPKFMAQPPLLPAEPFSLNRPDGGYSPVEQAIRDALDERQLGAASQDLG
jgi:hypothetical protein